MMEQSDTSAALHSSSPNYNVVDDTCSNGTAAAGSKFRQLNSAFDDAFQRAIDGLAHADCTVLMEEYIVQARRLRFFIADEIALSHNWRAEAEVPIVRNFLTNNAADPERSSTPPCNPIADDIDNNQHDVETRRAPHRSVVGLDGAIECGSTVTVPTSDPIEPGATARPMLATVLAVVRQRNGTSRSLDRCLVRFNDDDRTSMWRMASQLGVDSGGLTAAGGYECKACSNLRFSMLSAFIAHLRFKHGGTRYACTFCGRAFAQRDKIHAAHCALAAKYAHLSDWEMWKLVGCDRTIARDDGIVKWMDYVQPVNCASSPVETSDFFTCGTCNERLPSTVDWLRHRRFEHSEQISGFCDHCQFSAGDDDELLSQHCFTTHSNERKRYECPECGERFDREESLQSHASSHYYADDDDDVAGSTGADDNDDDALPTYHCVSCKLRCDTESEFKHHLSSEHDGYRLACMTCGDCFLDNEQLSEHMNASHPNTDEEHRLWRLIGSDRFKDNKWLDFVDPSRESFPTSFPDRSSLLVCGTCATPFISPILLLQHRRYCHNEQMTRFCNLCDFYSDDDAILGKHCATRHKARRDPVGKRIFCYACKTCEARFASTLTLLEHRRSAHREQLQGQCDECSFVPHCKKASCPVDRQMRLTMKLSWHCFHKHTKRPRYKCWHCEVRYNTAARLKLHEDTHGPRKFSCRQCNKRFRTERIRYVHEEYHGAKTFECDECGYRCATKLLLTNHTFTHDAVGKFKCAVCGRRFKQQQAWSRHKRLFNHPDRQPECEECGLRFPSDLRLRQHMWLHSGSPHWCQLCQHVFNSRATLLAHTREHDGVGAKFRCLLCRFNYASANSLRKHRLRLHETAPDVPPQIGEITKNARRKKRRASISKHMQCTALEPV